MNRIKFYALILAAFYVLAMFSFLYFGIEEAKAGFEQGWNDGKNKVNSEYLHLQIKPKTGGYTFPDFTINLLTGEKVSTEISEIKVRIINPPTNLFLKFAKASSFISGFIFLFFLIFIPVKSFKIIKSIIKDKLFDMKNIKRIRQIGNSLLFLYALSVFSGIIQDVKCNMIFKMENYNTHLSKDTFIFAIFGVVICMFAEILNYALKIKEEQDLTI